MFYFVADYCKTQQIIFFWRNMEHKKKGAIRFDADTYEYIGSLAKVSERTRTGEAAWLVKIVIRLQRDYPDTYNQITNKLNHEIFK